MKRWCEEWLVLGSWMEGDGARTCSCLGAHLQVRVSGAFLRVGGAGVWDSSTSWAWWLLLIRWFITKAGLAGSATGWQLSHGAHD